MGNSLRKRFAIVWLLTALAAPLNSSAAKPQPTDVEKLIEQLGDPQFAQRREAYQKLQECDPRALPALRKAINHPDLEVKNRVRELIEILVVKEALAPRRVTFQADGLALPAILKEVERQTGYKVGHTPNSERDAGNEGERKRRVATDSPLRLEFKDVPFWEAIERIGRELDAGSTLTVPDAEPILTAKAPRPHLNVRGAIRIELSHIHEDRDLDFTLKDDRPVASSKRLLTLTLSVRAEPKIRLLGVRPADSLWAVDENDSPFTCSVNNGLEVNGTKIRLQRTNPNSRTIKTLRGKLLVDVVVERKRIVMTDDIWKAVGTKLDLDNDVIEITDVEDGAVFGAKLYVAISVPCERDEIGAPLPRRRNGVDLRWAERIHLEDAQGNRCRGSDGFRQAGGRYWVTKTYIRRENDKNGAPKKLIVEDWKIVQRPIAFEFRDVRLP